MRWLLTGLIGLIALGGGYVAVQQRHGVEQGIQDRVAKVLAGEADFSRISFAPEKGVHEGVWGRVAYLSGRIHDAQSLEYLQTKVAEAGGVRKVVVAAVQQVPLIIDLSDYTFSASKSANEVAVAGLAGDFEAQQALISLAGQALDAREDQLNITLADPMPEGWVNSVSAGLAQLQGLDRGSLQITGTQAVLSGRVSRADAYRAAQQFPNVMAAEATMPGRIGTLDLALIPFTFGAFKDETGLRLTGGMPDGAALAEVEAYGGQVFPDLTVSSDMLVSLGVPTQTWVSNAKAAIDALASFDRGKATMGVGGLALRGQLTKGAAQGQTFEEIVARFDTGYPLMTGGVKGVFFTDQDRARLDLFSTLGADQTEALNGFVLPRPGFAISTEECIAQQQFLITNNPLTFDFFSDNPTAEGALTLDAFAGLQRACHEALEGYEITAKGYIDASESAFEGLDIQRAGAVVQALQERGVDTSVFKTAGFKTQQPEFADTAGALVEFGYFDRAAAEEAAAQEAVRFAEEQERARRIEERRAAVAEALEGVIGYEDINGFQVPILDFFATAETCADRYADFLSKATISFTSGSATLRDDGLEVVDGLAAISRACASALVDAEVEIAGHTDSQGEDAFNQTLSEERAIAVLNAMTARGVDTSIYRAVGYGEARPTADNSTPEGRKANRRIEFNIIVGEPSVISDGDEAGTPTISGFDDEIVNE